VLVANSAGTASVFDPTLTRSQYLTRYYADYRGIPRSNIVEIPFTVEAGEQTMANEAAVTTWRADHLQRVLDKVNAVQAQAVFAGPFTPPRIQVRNTADGAMVWASLPLILAGCRYIQASGGVRADNSSHQVYAWPGYVENIYSNLLYNNMGISSSPALYDDYATTPSSGSAGTYISNNRRTNIRVPTAATVAALGGANARGVLMGRIGSLDAGHAHRHSSFYTESEVGVRALIDRATYNMRRIAPAVARAKPLLVHARGGSAYSRANSVAMAKWLRDIGVNAKYYYDTTPSTSTEGYNEVAACPASGGYWAGYNEADITAGSVVEDPYYVAVGIRINEDMLTTLDNVITNAWESEFCGSSVLGASYGYEHTLLELHRGAIGGVTSSIHISDTTYSDMWSIIICLLRGMTWAEAGYYGISPYCTIAVGDPLWAPYGPAFSAI